MAEIAPRPNRIWDVFFKGRQFRFEAAVPPNIDILRLPADGTTPIRTLVIEGAVPPDIDILSALWAADNLPPDLRLPAAGGVLQLQTLELRCCAELPHDFAGVLQVSKLRIQSSSLERLPDKGELQGLMLDIRCNMLDIRYNNRLTSLPGSLGQLAALESLEVVGCPVLQSLPQSMGQLARLRSLSLRGCLGLQSLPASLGQLAALEELQVDGCHGLVSLPDSLGQLAALKKLEVSGRSLASLPESLGQLATLETLHLSGCDRLQSLPGSLGQLAALQSLVIGGCSNLEGLPDSLGRLAALRFLDISNCDALEFLPGSWDTVTAGMPLGAARIKLYHCPLISWEGSGTIAQLAACGVFSRMRVMRELLSKPENVLASLERLSWVAVLLAAASFTGAITPPGGYESNAGDLRLWGMRNATSTSMVRAPRALQSFFVLDQLCFGISLALVVFVVGCSMPRVSKQDAAEAGLVWLTLFIASALLLAAVACGVGAFFAGILAVYPEASAMSDVWVPFAASAVLLGVAALNLLVRWVVIFPGGACVGRGVLRALEEFALSRPLAGCLRWLAAAVLEPAGLWLWFRFVVPPIQCFRKVLHLPEREPRLSAFDPTGRVRVRV